MAATKNDGQLIAKKDARHQIEVELEKALPNLKSTLGKKKFNNRVRKAAKILIHGLPKKTNGVLRTKKAKKVSSKPSSSDTE